MSAKPAQAHHVMDKGELSSSARANTNDGSWVQARHAERQMVTSRSTKIMTTVMTVVIHIAVVVATMISDVDSNRNHIDNNDP